VLATANTCVVNGFQRLAQRLNRDAAVAARAAAAAHAQRSAFKLLSQSWQAWSSYCKHCAAQKRTALLQVNMARTIYSILQSTVFFYTAITHQCCTSLDLVSVPAMLDANHGVNSDCARQLLKSASANAVSSHSASDAHTRLCFVCV
jgi:hypothetical protein